MVKRILLNERIIFFLILFNAILIALLYFPRFKNNEELLFIDHLFVIIFTLEIFYKIKDQGFTKFWESGWNKFESLIILFSIPAIFHFFIPTIEIGFLVVFRLLRIFRFIRFFQFIPRIDTIFSGLRRALKSSVFVFFALVTLNFLFALLGCQFFRDLAPEYFGNPLISFYSIFQSFTIEGWNEIPRLLVERIESQDYSENLIYFYSWASRLFFILVVITGGMLGMSLANAIFVDEMTIDNNKNLEDKIDRLTQQIQVLQNQIEQNKHVPEEVHDILSEEEN
jgi:voltage-gated sodium channel